MRVTSFLSWSVLRAGSGHGSMVRNEARHLCPNGCSFPFCLVAAHHKEDEGAEREKVEDQLEGSDAANLRAPFVRQKDEDPTGLTHAESIGLITTQ